VLGALLGSSLALRRTQPAAQLHFPLNPTKGGMAIAMLRDLKYVVGSLLGKGEVMQDWSIPCVLREA
ncbi:unnamed protein product, partial [Urochloa humidicola]